jgi:hypothetical protein
MISRWWPHLSVRSYWGGQPVEMTLRTESWSRPKAHWQCLGVRRVSSADAKNGRDHPPRRGASSAGIPTRSPGDLDVLTGREVHEELAGTPTITTLIHIINGDTDRQYIYLARIDAWSFHDRSGPEFTQPGRGIYALDTIPMTSADLGSIALKPTLWPPSSRKH